MIFLERNSDVVALPVHRKIGRISGASNKEKLLHHMHQSALPRVAKENSQWLKNRLPRKIA
jgi:hypothetical protein